LQTAKVLVVSGALGFTGWLGRFGVRMRGTAFHTDEVDAGAIGSAPGVRCYWSDRPLAVAAVRPLASALGVSTADGSYRELGRGRVAVITKWLADPHNRAIDSRNTMLGIVHWLSHAE